MDEEFCWNLLQELKPDNEKHKPVPSDKDDMICENCQSKDIIFKKDNIFAHAAMLFNHELLMIVLNGVSMV